MQVGHATFEAKSNVTGLKWHANLEASKVYQESFCCFLSERSLRYGIIDLWVIDTHLAQPEDSCMA